MTFFTESNTQSIGVSARIAQAYAGIVETLQRRKIARTTYAELAGLSDRELNDMGISRGDIRRIAREAAQGTL